MNKYNLGGHSGCQIFLIENEDGTVYVRKISKNIEYNKRLEKQCKKQNLFNGDVVQAPKVLNQGYTRDGLYFFDMEYIQGVTLAEYIKTIEIGKIKGLVDVLVKNLVPNVNQVVSNEQKEKIKNTFEMKISTLRQNISNNDIINEALILLENHDWSKLIPSQCHGDMTLENIIVKNDSLYLIDFLDSFYDSWFLDIATLMQDVQIMWSYRFMKEINMNIVMRLIVFRDLLLDEIKKIDSNFINEIYYSLLLKLIRIYPYTNDELTYRFLDEKIELLLKNIKMMKTQEMEDV